ncbi:MAG: hypothetical protein KDE23_28755, partial [Caldilinea sp.]|nr:hypothetical protein [Caldilinea sp.]
MRHDSNVKRQTSCVMIRIALVVRQGNALTEISPTPLRITYHASRLTFDVATAAPNHSRIT